MNKLKSFFIAGFPMIAMPISGYGIYRLSTSGFSLIWLGAVLTTLPVMFFIIRVMMFEDIPRTAAHFPFLTITGFIGVVLSAYGVLQITGTSFQVNSLAEIDKLGVLSTLVGFVSFMFYNFWYSVLGRGRHPLLSEGSKMPVFEAVDTKGETVSSKVFLGSPVIYMFYRGNWCPLCMAQVKEIAAKYRELSSLGAKVVLLSPQPEKKTEALAKKFDVPLIFLTDVGNRAAKKLGLEMKDGLPAGLQMLGYSKDTVYPTVIITDAEGRIVYTDFTNNYRVRPEPEEFIKVLRLHTESGNQPRHV